MIRRPPRSTLDRSSAASDVYKRQGQVFAHLLGTDAFQECDVVNTTIPVTKWNVQVAEAKDIAGAVAKAFYIAKTGRQGPVLIDITKNAQNEMIEETEHVKCSEIRTYK